MTKVELGKTYYFISGSGSNSAVKSCVAIKMNTGWGDKRYHTVSIRMLDSTANMSYIYINPDTHVSQSLYATEGEAIERIMVLLQKIKLERERSITKLMSKMKSLRYRLMVLKSPA